MAEIGGKGLFTKEIEEALIAGHIDLAVHSLKDMETWLPDGLAIACVLPRDDPRDALVVGEGDEPCGPAARARESAPLRCGAGRSCCASAPISTIVPIRGNVNTRLRKLEAGEVDALVLALCGLERLGEAGLATEILSREVMLPAVGQGALAVECRAADEGLRRLLEPLHDPISAACVGAERAMLAALDGSCRTPIAGLAELDGDRLTARRIAAEAGRQRRDPRPSRRRHRRRGGARHRARQRVAAPRRPGFGLD